MRKDVRLGMAIGGVLLLLVVVYLIISSFSSPHKSAVASAGSENSAPAETGGDQSGGGALPVTTVTDGGTHADAHPAQADASAQQPGAAASPGTGVGNGAAEGSGGEPAAAAGNTGGHAQWMYVLDPPRDGDAAERQPQRQAHSGGAFQQALGASGGGDAAAGGGTPLTGSPQSTGGNNLEIASGDVIPSGGIPLTGSHARVAAATQAAGEASAAGGRTHVVAIGETYMKISAAVYGSSKYYALIEQANPGINPNNLKPGTVIRIPEFPRARAGSGSMSASGSTGDSQAVTAAATIDPAAQYRVQSGDSLYRISERLYGDASMVQKLYDLNKDAIGPDMRKLKLNMVLKLPAPPKSAVH